MEQWTFKAWGKHGKAFSHFNNLKLLLSKMIASISAAERQVHVSHLHLEELQNPENPLSLWKPGDFLSTAAKIPFF